MQTTDGKREENILARAKSQCIRVGEVLNEIFISHQASCKHENVCSCEQGEETSETPLNKRVCLDCGLAESPGEYPYQVLDGPYVFRVKREVLERNQCGRPVDTAGIFHRRQEQQKRRALRAA